MIKSLNSKVFFTTKANLFINGFLPKYGNIMIGNNSIEFYNKQNIADYIQIPWNQIKNIRAQVFFKNLYFRGFFIDTIDGVTYNLVVKNTKKALKHMYPILGEKIVRNKTLF